MKETHILFLGGTASTRDTEDDTNNRAVAEAGNNSNFSEGVKDFERNPSCFARDFWVITWT